ncbi:predicted protein [Uncinocarpus reesii 1704]|uniref:Uncharacterized protein n=1 Tax=Uncinocarpus reesii (strain UAMH 1704) TaxID=336963 RepID=C4JVA2_UNCRE|nr:uncharacterized protein UREG_06494 [Uncinocarpus reesii 1704]EEP81629.1 predicted protein [Uncinocarpus reesii 1704]
MALRDFDAKKKALREMIEYMQERISSNLYGCVYDKSSPREWLVALQHTCSQSLLEQARDVDNEYANLRKSPTRANVTDFIHRWYIVSDEMRKPDMVNNMMVWRFLDSIRKLNPEFSDCTLMRIIDRELEEKNR